MTTGAIQVGHDGVRLRLSGVPIHLPDPVAAIARALAISTDAAVTTPGYHLASNHRDNAIRRGFPHGFWAPERRG